MGGGSGAVQKKAEGAKKAIKRGLCAFFDLEKGVTVSSKRSKKITKSPPKITN